MPTYAVYDSTSKKVAWLAQQPSPPAGLPAGLDFVAVPDGAVLASGGSDIVDGALVDHSLSFNESRSAKAAAAMSAYVARVQGGYTHTDGHVFQLGSDRLGSTGVINLIAIAARCQLALSGAPENWPDGSFIRDAANENVVYTAAEALAVASGAGSYVTAVRARYWVIKASIDAAADQAGAECDRCHNRLSMKIEVTAP
jgi:hypothetical protein